MCSTKKTEKRVQEGIPVKRGTQTKAVLAYKHTENVKTTQTTKRHFNLATTEIRKPERTFEQKLAGNIK